MRSPRRKGAPPLFLVALAIVLASGLLPATAYGESIAKTRQEIATLSAELSQQEKTSEITANEYDQDKVELGTLNSRLLSLQIAEHQKRLAIADTTTKLSIAEVKAYIYSADATQILSLFDQKISTSDARKIFQQLIVGNLTNLRANFEAEKKALDLTIGQVATVRNQMNSKTNAMRALLAQNIAQQNNTQRTLHTLTSRLRGEIIAYEIAVGVSAARHHNQAGEEQAIAAASAVGGQDAANQVILAIQAAVRQPTINEIAGTAQGLRAVHAAESQIGVPYVWGGETPGYGFDCSGLVQWAWRQAGFSIPRTTFYQWPALHHVALNALQPGDLLFYYNLDGDHAVDHVVMYVGSGPYGVDTIIAAAHTGTNISLAPLFFGGLIGAARP